VRWAALVGAMGSQDLDALQARLRIPGAFAELAALTGRVAMLVDSSHLSQERFLAEPANLMKLLATTDALRRPERFEAWLQVHDARALAAGQPAEATIAQHERLQGALRACAKVKLDRAELQTLAGPAIAALLHARRLEVLSGLK
jgi:tRNA nucleotidyltransferase (CCA-adding enzyme)